MAENQKTASPRWVKIALFASLALNLAIVGVVVGAASRFGPSDGKRPPRMDELAGAYTQALLPEERREIGRRILQEQRKSLPKRSEFRADYQVMLNALRAAPFDATQVEAVLDRQRAFGAKRLEAGHDLLLDHLTQMTDAERQAFADRLEEVLQRRKKGHGGPKGQKPRD